MSRLAVPFEELAAAVRAAIHPDEIAEPEGAGHGDEGAEPPTQGGTDDTPPPTR